MPLFEYKCNICEQSFEELVSGNSPEISCPACSSTEVTKQLSVFAASAGGSSASAAPCGSPKPGCGSGGFT